MAKSTENFMTLPIYVSTNFGKKARTFWAPNKMEKENITFWQKYGYQLHAFTPRLYIFQLAKNCLQNSLCERPPLSRLFFGLFLPAFSQINTIIN